MKQRSRLLTTSALCFSTLLLVTSLASAPALAFDPDEGADTAVAAPSTLPSTQPLFESRSRSSGVAFPKVIRPAAPAPIPFQPLPAAKPVAAVPVIPVTTASAPVTIAPAPVPVTIKPAMVPVPAVPAPIQAAATPAPVVIPPVPKVVEVTPPPSRIAFPPVDPAVMAKAEQQMRSTAPVQVTPPPVVPVTPVPRSVELTPQVARAPVVTENGFIAPLPLISPVSPTPVMPTPRPAVVAAPAVPVMVTPVPPSVAAAPVVPVTAAPVVAAPETLSRNSKTILSKIPSKLDAPKPTKAGKVSLSRTSPELTALDVKGKSVDAYEAAGIKISVRRPGLDTNYELNRAYTALSGGDSATAIDVYKSILSTEPTNADALFGLASIYHRQGQLDKARPLYGTLLQHYPNHREGINNFLVLVSDEAPQESLAELERLEQRNPDFSPIPAQQAIVLSKLGYTAQAREKMIRAIELAPNNFAYKYNLAILLDRQGDAPGAIALYRSLIEAANRGESIPASVDALQKRLTYLSTQKTVSSPVPLLK